jgi:glyoxylase-like metal-dependent hydrolase (beta-lactamase superfamily II)
MKIGKYDLRVVETGSFVLDGGAMFGVVPKMLWQNTNPPDEMNRITLHARNLLLVSDTKKILIDTGIGSFWDSKFIRIYHVDYAENQLSSLEKHGINPSEITDVLLTHLHFDHTGGSTTFQDGRWLPTFPNATYHVQKKHFEWAQNPSERDRASFIGERFLPIMNEGILNLIDGEKQIDDEIEFLVINGHTFSQQLVKISDSSNTVLYCGDLMPTSSHIPLPYVMGYDLQPILTVEEKKNILPQAVDKNWLLFFEHDPLFVAASVMKNEKGFFAKEKFENLP